MTVRRPKGLGRLTYIDVLFSVTIFSHAQRRRDDVVRQRPDNYPRIYIHLADDCGCHRLSRFFAFRATT